MTRMPYVMILVLIAYVRGIRTAVDLFWAIRVFQSSELHEQSLLPANSIFRRKIMISKCKLIQFLQAGFPIALITQPWLALWFSLLHFAGAAPHSSSFVARPDSSVSEHKPLTPDILPTRCQKPLRGKEDGHTVVRHDSMQNFCAFNFISTFQCLSSLRLS